jgi:alkylation response protein AidB-like acyl-CoA dehydrogenase
MRRSLYEDVHEDFRASFRTFLQREVLGEEGRYGEWERAGIVPREVFALAGRGGFLGMAVPEAHGGAGAEDFRLNLVIGEETQRVGVGGLGLGITLQNDICLPYFLTYCNAEQSERWLGGIASGELITALAMTEPGIGSDLAAMSTSARREGDHYVVSGAKTFITNGINADLVIVVARTDPGAGSRGISLLVVERGMPGFTRGRKLDKIGMHAQDTAELFFDDVRVPVANLLGHEGGGFVHLMERLPRERMSIAYAALASARAGLDWTVDYTTQRTAFGQPIAAFQNTQFELASMVTEVDVLEAYLDKAVRALNDGTLTAVDAAKAKLWATEVQHRVLDRCLQLFGGYGYMAEYPIGRAYADSRVQTIYGGTSEIMKTIIAREVTGLRT